MKRSLDETKENKKIKTETNLMFNDLCFVFDEIEATTKRLKIQEIVTDYFLRTKESVNHIDFIRIVLLCCNKLDDDYKGIVLGLGESLLLKAIANATGRSLDKLKKEFKETGDLGLLAAQSRNVQPTMFKPKPLSVDKVFDTLLEIAILQGNQSQSKKIEKIKLLLISCSSMESKYLIRLLEGKLRIGLAEKTVLISLAQAFSLKNDAVDVNVKILKDVFYQLPSYKIVVEQLFQHSIVDLPEHCQLTPMIPLKPMLAHPTKSISEVLNRFQNIKFTCEYKYDGERTQIHKTADGKVMVFSRNLENSSEKYPDLIELSSTIGKEGVTSFILDCEAVAFDAETNKILPFQVLSTRKRKDVSTADLVVKVKVFAFDLLYLNGESLIQKSLEERRNLLFSSFQPNDSTFGFALSISSNQIEDIQSFLDESVVSGCEGLMVKTLDADASYEPSKRSRNWLKLKKDYLDGVGDSFDLVVMGAYEGKGKRTGVYGGFLLGVWNEELEQYQSICKIGTGFTDEDLKTHYEFFKDYITDAPKFDNSLACDVWFEPIQVWEVLVADLSLSPVHKACSGMVPGDERGISLRFPRFVRIREDKKSNETTSARQVVEMYLGQSNIQGLNGMDEDDDY